MAVYKLIIFDFDGTLADSLSTLQGTLNKAAARFGFRQLTDDEFVMLRSRGNREFIRYLGVPMWKVPMIAANMRRMASDDADSLSLFPGAGAVLRRLHDAGIGLAVVSSNSRATIVRVMGAEIAALFSHYECGVGIFGKAAKFRKVLRRMDLPGSSAIAIGDEARDIDAAHEAGIDAGAVTWGFATSELLRCHTPEILFNSMSEIADRLVE
ncbi:MAG TPA: HAD hydrolase-like protein [Telmatospirillum sp.]|nr:HAD hydrolase-like protein [Telmatospirillum sp.]